jgi:predicted phosphodiesterase
MRIAIISDIHEDIQMLEKSVAFLNSVGYDLLVCLGDITGFAPAYYNHTPDANACVDLLKDKADIVLAGNHDLFSTQRLPSYHLEKNIPENWYNLSLRERFEISNNQLWLYEEEENPNLSYINELYINTLQEKNVLDVGSRKVLFSHYLQPDLLGIGRWFPYRVGELRPHFRFMEECNTPIAFVGHCHPEGVTVLSKLFWSAPSIETVKLGYKPRIILCPAIVAGKNSSGFIIYETKSNEIIPFRLRN